MICDQCLKEIERDITGRMGCPVTCLAYSCENKFINADGKSVSGCARYVNRLMMVINRCTIPVMSKHSLDKFIDKFIDEVKGHAKSLMVRKEDESGQNEAH